jgi:raffinose/stachyose/melibiose transport system substrate-binding protein
MGITGNNATKHPEEVKAFLAWLATPEGAQTTSTYLPLGFFPMINTPITFADERVTEILALNEGKVMDARFVWARLLDMYTPMVEQLNAIARGETTPEAAAEVFAAEQAKVLGK